MLPKISFGEDFSSGTEEFLPNIPNTVDAVLEAPLTTALPRPLSIVLAEDVAILLS